MHCTYLSCDATQTSSHLGRGPAPASISATLNSEITSVFNPFVGSLDRSGAGLPTCESVKLKFVSATIFPSDLEVKFFFFFVGDGEGDGEGLLAGSVRVEWFPGRVSSVFKL